MNPLVNNAELDARVIEFDACQGQRTFGWLYAFLGRFVAYPSEHAHVAHTLWIGHCYLMDRWETTPRLAFLSAEPASGKTRALELTEMLTPNPVPTVNVSPAYLFRKVANPDGVTILFDEVDTIFGPRAKDNEDIRGLLNAGHRRGATSGRCVPRGKEMATEEFPAYAPVALAGIGELPDTILSRSVIVRMRRRHAGERVEPFRRRIHAQEASQIKEALTVWARALGTVDWPELPQEINDRDADVWEPLIAVADAVGGAWPERAREAGIALVTAAKEAEPSLGIRLLADLKLIFGDAGEMSSKSLLAGLCGLEEAPWSDIRGKPLDEKGLARRLRPYGVKSRTVRLDGATPKGYSRADLLDVWRRYLPPSSGISATPATAATSEDNSSLASEFAKSAEPAAYSDVAGVAAVADSAGVGLACDHCRSQTGELLDVSFDGQTLKLHRPCIDPFRHQNAAKAPSHDTPP